MDTDAAPSRWRWTIVVVRQFSFVVIFSCSHPPAGIRWGREDACPDNRYRHWSMM
jgi:hypothetical protein